MPIGANYLPGISGVGLSSESAGADIELGWTRNLISWSQPGGWDHRGQPGARVAPGPRGTAWRLGLQVQTGAGMDHEPGSLEPALRLGSLRLAW